MGGVASTWSNDIQERFGQVTQRSGLSTDEQEIVLALSVKCPCFISPLPLASEQCLSPSEGSRRRRQSSPRLRGYRHPR